MHIQCTYRAPIVDMLRHLPSLPLIVEFNSKKVALTKQDQSGMYHALRLRDRVRHIDLRLSPSVLHKCLGLMGESFPILQRLSLWFTTDKMTAPTVALTLPKAFSAPNLHHLTVPCIGSPQNFQVLTTTTSLVKLEIWNIQTSASYFPPSLLVARLSSLPQLRELSIGFSVPIPRPSAEMELLDDSGVTVTLPNLKYLRFRGVSTYLECLVAQIRAILLERLDIMFFNQTAFALPNLSHLINTTDRLKHPTAQVSFCPNGVSLITAQHISGWSDNNIQPLCMGVTCQEFDWQIHCAAQLCSELIPALAGVREVSLDLHGSGTPNQGEIDGTMWHELLRSFAGVRELHIERALLEELSRALRVNMVGAEPGFLPDLQNIVAEDNRFAAFIDARRLFAGRSIRFLPRQPLI